jgi:hypothetical protein
MNAFPRVMYSVVRNPSQAAPHPPLVATMGTSSALAARNVFPMARTKNNGVLPPKMKRRTPQGKNSRREPPRLNPARTNPG